ncbi:acyl-ACP--UDP-N-acetylglucosamine O-acyltransferase [bacterium]|nr:acyl-ACP--UDP-N-acetylglucosamine O-acyltransferase [bacterium]
MAIHPSAIIDSSAVIHESVEIGPNVIVDANVEIGEGTEIMAGTVIGPNTKIGKRNRIHYHTVIGHEPQFVGFDRTLNTGVIIGDDNEIREFAQIHRAIHEGNNTIIGNHNFMMATAHVAHDCHVGNHVVLASFSALAGHVVVEDRVFLSGMVAVHQFCRIGKGAMAGGHAGISKDVPPFMTVKGGFGFLTGVNVIGLRRAGVSGQTRLAIRQAFRNIFRSGLSVPHALRAVCEEWEAKQEPMPEELKYLVDFCSAPSKRGLMSGRSREYGVENWTEDDGVE